MNNNQLGVRNALSTGAGRRCQGGCGRAAILVSMSRSLCSACYTRRRSVVAKRNQASRAG